MSLASFAFGESQPLSGALEAYEQISLLTAARLPLHEGLRALAEESSDRHTRPWLLAWAAAVEQGQTLEQGLEGARNRIPAHLADLLQAAASSGHLAETLESFLAARRTTMEIRRSLGQALVYPALLLVFAIVIAAVFVVSMGDLSRDLARQAEDAKHWFSGRDLGLRIPPLLRGLANLYFQRHVILVVAVSALAFLLLLRYSPARFVLTWLLAQIPGWGSHEWHLALAETARHLQALVRHGQPLTTAVRLAAQAVDHPLLARGAPEVARELEAGQSLAEALRHRPAIPESVRLLVEMGERRSQLASMLGLVAAICEERARAEQLTLKLTVPPLAFLVVLMIVLGFMGTIYAPMVQMINVLS